MHDTEEGEPVRRSDWRTALAWISQRRVHTVFVVLLLAAAGIASSIGLLRWQDMITRWSFAILCWVVAVALAVNARRLKR